MKLKLTREMWAHIKLQRGKEANVKKRFEVIKAAYYNPTTGYVGVDKLYRKLKTEDPETKKDYTDRIKREDITHFLKKQATYIDHKKASGPTNSFVAHKPLEEMQIDLVEWENSELQNGGYGLTCIDIFIKQAEVIIMKNKTAETVTAGFKKILKKMGIPENIYCDEGAEFTSGVFGKLMKEKKINIIFLLGHAPFIERFHRTLKRMLELYMDAVKSKTISKVLPTVLKNYNNSYHSTIEMTPNEVTLNKDNTAQAAENIVKHSSYKKRPKIEAGDTVKIKKKMKSFEKSYKVIYRAGEFVVDKVEKRGNAVLFYVIGDTRKRPYVRTDLLKLTETLEEPEIEADNANTLEDTLRKARKAQPKHLSHPQKKTIRETGIEGAYPDDERLKPTAAQGVKTRTGRKKNPKYE
jgi:hypothetical protein